MDLEKSKMELVIFLAPVLQQAKNADPDTGAHSLDKLGEVWFSFFIFSFGLFPQSLRAEEVPTVRVRIAEKVREVEVQGYDLSWGKAERFPALEFLQQGEERLGTRWKLSCEGSHVRVEGLGRERGRSRVWSAPLQISSSAGFLSVDGRILRGALVVWSMGAGRCDLVNHMDLEQYLKGLVNAEFNSRWHPEAVKAQVIAARTYALFQLNERRRDEGGYFDLHATVQDQVYGGPEREDFIAATWVDRTRGQVLTTGNGKPIKAFYHSTCGGETAPSSEVWGKAYQGVEGKVRCPYCIGSPVYTWEVPVRKSELEGVLEKALALSARAILRGVEVVARDAGGRVRSLKTEWVYRGKKLVRELSGVRFRDLLGTQKVRSTRFDMQSKAQYYWVKGRGHGHGVGMCQYGAKKMGEEGFSSEKILKFYYPGAKLTHLW